MTLRHADDAAFSVVIAQTTDSRTALLQRLLANSSDVERLGAAINALLERVGDGVRAQREQLQAIVDSQGRASHLVDQLLALADESRDSLRLEAVALDALVRDVLRFMLRADQLGVDLGASGLDETVTVQAHAALVEGILGNLIDNALRHGGSVAGRSPEVTVELVAADAEVILAVTDNGPGLSATERERLLQRWTQSAPGERLGAGAGLGLAIVTRYAELMHARFELVDGPLGIGLCARIVFAQPALA